MGQTERSGGFTALLVVVFLNAFIDIGHLSVVERALLTLEAGDARMLLLALVNALILLPFILLFSPCGFIADRFVKPRVMRVAAWFGLFLALAAVLCYHLGWFWPAVGLAVLSAAQCTLFLPAQYGYLRELVRQSALASANGWVQAASTVAVLAGIGLFSWSLGELVPQTADTLAPARAALQALAPFAWLLVAAAALEVLLTGRLAAVPVVAGGPPGFRWGSYLHGRYTMSNLVRARANRIIWLAIVGLAMLWGGWQVVVAAFPAYAETLAQPLHGEFVPALFGYAGVGVVVGALLVVLLSRDHIETGLIPVGAVGIVLGLFALPHLGSYWLYVADFLFLGVLGGLLMVPLNALIQFNAAEGRIGRVLAASHFVQRMTMLLALAASLAALRAEAAAAVLLAVAIVALLGALYTLAKFPQSLMRFIVARLLASHYRLKVIGLDHLPAQGGVLMLGNHVSTLDWAMVQMACPRPVRFVVERHAGQRWHLRWLLRLFGAIVVPRGHGQDAAERATALLNAGEVVCLFPEGAVSRNGQLGEFRRGFEQAARAAAGGVILPFYQRGLWGSRFSHAAEKHQANRRESRMRHVIVAFGEPLPLATTAEELKQTVFQLSVTSWKEFVDTLPTLPVAWLHAAKRQPGATALIDASTETVLSHRRLITAVLLFSRRIRRLPPGRTLGIALPSSAACTIANLAAMFAGRVVVNLNYTASAEALRSGLAAAGVTDVITADAFLARLRQRGIDPPRMLPHLRWHAMEDLRADIGRGESLWRLTLASLLPASLLLRLFASHGRSDATAAILFSSGSEGVPKGVELTHRNILANARQISDVLNPDRRDVILANLPIFHAFGLTATLLLPLLEGIPIVCSPDPTDALGSARAIARYRATVLFGTSTFLRLYVRNQRVHPLMLASLRAVVTGAEKLNARIGDAFTLKFHVDIYEGYGVTETTPVAAVNIPNALDTETWKVQIGSRPGTVGMPLPGTCIRVVDPQTLQMLPPGEDGLLLIGGAQVMKGYLDDPERTARAIVECDGLRWYKTGDKGHQDVDGFITIVDRYSRFAKLGGEMIGLGQVEADTRAALDDPELEVVAVTLPDERKGERIVLLSERAIDAEELRRQLLGRGVNPLSLPGEIIEVGEIPRLGTGKVDFGASRALAARLCESGAGALPAPGTVG